MKYTWLALCWSLLSSISIQAQESTFNAGWQFLKQESAAVEDLPGAEAWTTVNLPHTWNNLDAFDDTDGYERTVGWYQKELFLPKTEQNQIILKFEGAYQWTQVYVNGKLAGEHKGGYTAFAVDLSPLVSLDAENTITLRVDSRHNPAIPPMSGDFTFYGGVYRDVYLIRKGEQHFDRLDGSTKGVYLSSPKTSERSATLKIKAKAKNTSAQNAKLTVRTILFQPDGQQIGKTEAPLSLSGDSQGIAVMDLTIAQPDLWSPAQPNLYRVEVVLLNEKGQAIDQYTSNYGFRWFEMDKNRAFLLNGKPLNLIGVNRHQDYPGLANAMPDALHRRDMEILKAMGGNFIRIAHYPQDPALLEACDELGILVWEEIPIVNTIMVTEAFEETSTRNLQEMIRQHHNHPSVIMWGFMNEVLLRLKNGLKDNPDLTEADYLKAVGQLTRHLHKTAKKEDPARWTTIAHHGNYDIYEQAGINDITDIVGWNLYYGWYSADMPRAGEFLDQFHKDHPDQGIIVAEYGGGSDPRLHATNPKRFDFTVEWQTMIHASYYQQILDRPHVMGGAIWNFADFGSEGRKDPVPHINSKGILHHDRTPKDSYLYYQAALAQQPYLQIGSQDWRYRADFTDETGTFTQPVWIFSNQPTVEVTANGTLLGTFETANYHLVVDVPFRAGSNRIEVSAGKGLSQETEFYADALPPNLSALSSKDIDLRMNLGTHFHYTDLLTKEAWLPERAYQPGSFGYVDGTALMSWKGFRVGSDKEIFGSDNEPIYQTHRDSLNTFRADVPDGWYEVTLHFAEVYSKAVREKLAYNLGAEGEEVEIDADRLFHINANGERVRSGVQLEDFQATAIRFQVKATDQKGLNIELDPEKGTPFLSGIAIRGL
jgi:beta-galactosidase